MIIDLIPCHDIPSLYLGSTEPRHHASKHFFHEIRPHVYLSRVIKIRKQRVVRIPHDLETGPDAHIDEPRYEIL